MKWIISGILAILLGMSNKFVLVGTNSPQMLILAGDALIIFGYVRLICSQGKEYSSKKRIAWRIALVIIFGLCTLIGLILLIGFPIATMLRGENINGHSDMISAIIAGSILSVLLAPAIIILKRALPRKERETHQT